MDRDKDIILKERIVEKVTEMLDCAKNVDCGGGFEIIIRYIKGELITKIDFLDKDY
jgi:hypothetical protein